MIYELECNKCNDIIELDASIKDHESLIKPGIEHGLCGGRYFQIFTKVDRPAIREPFPKGLNENMAPNPVFIRDKIHARDIGQEWGTGSKWVDNDM